MVQEFVQSMVDTMRELMRDIHTAIPGKIIEVNAETGRANVLPVMKKKQRNGKYIDYPILTDVPIVFPQGAGQSVSMAFPVKTGDYCLLIVAEQALDYWMFGVETQTDLQFDITNAICIPGLFQNAPASLASANSSGGIVFQVGDTVMNITEGGVIINGEPFEIDPSTIAIYEALGWEYEGD